MTLDELAKRYPTAEINIYLKDENNRHWQYKGHTYANIEVEDFEYHNTSYGEWLNVYKKS